MLGTSGVPAAIATAQVACDAKTPMIGLIPILLQGPDLDWTVSVAQPVDLMVEAVVERMKKTASRQ